MKKALIVAGVIVVLALVVWASLRDTGPRGEEVEVGAVERRTISSRVKATGEITPERKVEISAKVVGEIIALPVVEGQQVKAGQLLLEIERDLYESARDQARAALRQAEVSVHRQEVQLADAERTLRRNRELIADGLVSEEALDAAELAVATVKVELEAQQHLIEQYRSALQRAADDLARTTILSPMDGTVIQLNAEQGETVVPGSTNLPGSVILTVADMSVLLAEVEVSEVDVVNVELGQEAEITVDALGEAVQKGRVVEIATSGREDPALGTIDFAVKVAIDDPDPRLRPAMTAKVDILTATKDDALIVPIQAVVKRRFNASGEEVEGSEAKGLD
jgi:HlyD family secretion protein